MTVGTLTLAGQPINKLRLCVPGKGVWHADVDMADGEAVSGRVTLQLGDVSLAGTVDSERSGDFAGKRRVRLIGGAGGWRTELPSKPYHNDAGVKAAVVVSDAAAACGESVEWTSTLRLGPDYVREAGIAERVLEAAIGGLPWHVGLDGVTRIGARAPSTPDAKAYDVVDYNPRDRLVTLAVDDISLVGCGATIANRLPAALTITAFDYVVTPDSALMYAWCDSSGSYSELADALRKLAEHVAGQRLFGRYRYRVVQMSVDRVTLQAVRKASGLPDIANVDMWPGVAGAHAQLAPGAEVHVEFEGGDRTLPMVVGFGGRGKPGHAPTKLELGGAAGPLAARQNDAVEILLPPAVFSGTIGGSPASGVLTFPANKAMGVVTGASAKVSIA